ncbi:MAG: DUF1015 domain-containing protein [Anaerolineales bacterium]|nr:DUF1015 domain-containing protein [Anaerolineales bacterium]
MATIKPFRAIRYNQDRIDSINNVISQPYDRVRYGLQDQYYDLSEYNITRIIKGKEMEADNEQDNVYTRAKNYLQEWLEQGILQREDQPALYVYHQTFPLPDGSDVTRRALLTAFELARFEEGIVLPHEKTHAGPKVDRLNLTRATETYFGNIFMLYPDPRNQVDAILAQALDREPDITARELHEKDVLHQVWIVKDPDVIDRVREEMADKKNIIIADGHHRYETALTYRDEMREKYPNAPANAGFNYRMTAMVSMSDPGLTILPTHRLIFDYQKMTAAEIVKKAREFFEVKEVDGRQALEAELSAAEGEIGVMGLVTQEGAYFLRLQDTGVMEKLAPDRVEAWRELDVSILHNLVFDHIMDISEEKIDNKENIQYLREPDLGYEDVAEKATSFLFVLNATRIEQVKACTKAGEKMPQKSTDFYPKVITGLAMLPISPEERL